MPTEKMWVTYDDGAHLSRSQKTPGDYSPLTRDDGTNELGHVTLRPLTEDDDAAATDPQPVFIYVDENSSPAQAQPDEVDEAIFALVTLAVGLAVVTAAPVVKRWWDNTAFPVMRSAVGSTWSFVRRTPRGDNRPAGSASPAVVDGTPAPLSGDVVAALDAPGISMSMSEWRERFRLMLMAGAFRDDQWKTLSAARVEGDDALPVLQNAMAQLSPQQIAERVRLMLEANPSLLDERTSATLRQLLSGTPVDGGEYVPRGSLATGERHRRDELASG